MCLVPTRATDLTNAPHPTPIKDIRLFGTCRQQSLPHTGGRWRKSQRNVSGPLSTAQQLPEWTAWVPKTSQGRPGGARQCGRVPPPPELRAKAHTGAPLPATLSRDEGAEIPGSLHPQGLLFPRKSECLLSAAVFKAGGWWRTARVCKPIQGWMGTEAPGGSRRRASDNRLPLPPNPDQPSRSSFNLREDKAALEAAQWEAPSTLREGVCVWASQSKGTGETWTEQNSPLHFSPPPSF